MTCLTWNPFSLKPERVRFVIFLTRKNLGFFDPDHLAPRLAKANPKSLRVALLTALIPCHQQCGWVRGLTFEFEIGQENSGKEGCTLHQLITRQVLGEYEVKDPLLAKYHSLVGQMCKSFEDIIIRQIPKEENTSWWTVKVGSFLSMKCGMGFDRVFRAIERWNKARDSCHRTLRLEKLDHLLP